MLSSSLFDFFILLLFVSDVSNANAILELVVYYLCCTTQCASLLIKLIEFAEARLCQHLAILYWAWGLIIS